MNGNTGLSNLQNSGLEVGIYSLIIIFSIIIIFVVLFSVVPGIRAYMRNPRSKGTANGGNKNNSNIPAGDSAAIAAAIFLFMDEIHDKENRVMTIKRVSRTYSPWNSKIYGVNWLKTR
ncbi:MAG TPA: hypothetical protein VHO90_14125 [Bacteroidales bacterium]|nr:hypothetical protein [Bacteroidales bacterium]